MKTDVNVALSYYFYCRIVSFVGATAGNKLTSQRSGAAGLQHRAFIRLSKAAKWCFGRL
jgi:hypothetical protein